MPYPVWQAMASLRLLVSAGSQARGHSEIVPAAMKNSTGPLRVVFLVAQQARGEDLATGTPDFMRGAEHRAEGRAFLAEFARRGSPPLTSSSRARGPSTVAESSGTATRDLGRCRMRWIRTKGPLRARSMEAAVCHSAAQENSRRRGVARDPPRLRPTPRLSRHGGGGQIGRRYWTPQNGWLI